MRALCLLLAVAALPVGAQTVVADTTAPARYVPLDLGNEWVYAGFDHAWRETVVGDSTVAGQTYAVVRHVWIGDAEGRPDSTLRLVRFDDASASLATLSDDGTESLGCPLDADFGASVTCGDESATVGGGYETFIDPHPSLYRELETTVKRFRTATHETVEYAVDFGRTFIKSYDQDGLSLEGWLVSARIDGRPTWLSPAPDPTDPAEYYPLTVGSEWETFRFLLAESGRTRRVIERDTLIGGVRYVSERSFYAHGTTVPDWGEGTARWLRFDDASARLMQWADGSEQPASCAFDAPFDTVIECNRHGRRIGQIVVGQTVTRSIEVGEDAVVVPATKGFDDLFASFADAGQTGGFGAGLGPLPPAAFGTCTDCYETFTFVRLVASDGTVQEYGARYAVASGEEPDLDSLTLRAGPTPTGGPLMLWIEGAREAVTVEVFDALGRRVARAETTAPRLGLAAEAWAPGVYLVRATSGDQSAMASVVRR